MQSDKNKLLVSVLMPVYNGEKFIGEAIDSILSQTYKHFELIIINDCSTDHSQEIIDCYYKVSSQIKVINLKKRMGAYAAANVGMKYAQGEFIAPMDSDDVSHPRRLEKEVQYLLENREVIVVGTFARIIDKEGNNIGKKVFATKHGEIYRQFFEVHPIVHPSSMIRRSLLPSSARLYHNTYGVNDDYYTLFTLFGYGKFANIPEFLLQYRIHLGNFSLQRLKQKFFNTVKIRLDAIFHLGYRPTFFSLMSFLLQIVWVGVMPEKLLFYIYLFIKGIYTPSDIIYSFSFKIDHYFFRLKTYSFGRLGFQTAH